jgi:DNA-binding CsgD family transcriptional regulator
VLSGVTYEMVAERLPEGVWVRELGTHPLRDLPRPERVVQLCHPDLCNEFPPLRVAKAAGVHNLPTQLTSFVGRTELDVVRLACEGLGNKEIATRLFVSPRTVQAHLSHVYSKLGVSSRMQLAQVVSRH